MAHILLTGAGFSRNWGGWLANECFEYLLSCADLTTVIQQELWKSKNQNLGFENTLGELKALYAKHRDGRFENELQTFERMLEGMFHMMRQGFAAIPFDPTREVVAVNPQPEFVRDFLCRFHAIFTLNQDTLLEQHYQILNIQQGSQGKWFGMQTPGLEPVTVGGTPYQSPGVFTPSKPPFRLRERHQPYFKLHGSSNWRSDGASALLVMGESKEADLDKVPLLAWYRDKFARMVREPNTRVMIIGYGFQDIHINKIIEAAAAAGTKIFIVDPEGVDVLNRARCTENLVGGIKDKIWQSIIGASRRNLVETLTRDTVERAKVMHFFTGLSV
jgi:SIR2-like domain